MGENIVTLVRDGECDWKIIAPSESECLNFAASELRRYVNAVTGAEIGGEAEADHRGRVVFEIDRGEETGENDEYVIAVEKEALRFKGNNERSVLFAVYAFLQERLGISWSLDGHEVIPHASDVTLEVGERRRAARFKTRGFFMENKGRHVAIMDWMTKNGMNTAYVGLKDWSKNKNDVVPEVRKRGLTLAVGGHSYFHFLDPKTYFEDHPDWYGHLKAKGGRDTRQLCLSSEEGLAAFNRNVLEFLKKNPYVAGLAIWPVDNKFNCECERCENESFIDLYARMMGGLKSFLRKNGLDINVEQLAYNAALSREMLKPTNTVAENLGCDTMLAYWGRNYQYPLAESPVETDVEARRIIEEWAVIQKRAGYSFSILEYYPDFWMLTSIYPPLTNVVARDMDYYHSLGVDGIQPLIVPCEYGPFQGKNVPWVSWMELNAAVFARCGWEAELNVDEFLGEYCLSRYGEEAGTLVRRYFAKLEALIPALTGFNIPLFRLRFPDVWQLDVTPDEGGIKFVAEDWTPETPRDEVEVRRLETCRTIADALLSFREENPLRPDEFDPRIRARLGRVKRYFDYVIDRMASLRAQLDAREMIREKEFAKAESLLREAVEIEDRLFGEDTESCEKWLREISGKANDESEEQ